MYCQLRCESCDGACEARDLPVAAVINCHIERVQMRRVTWLRRSVGAVPAMIQYTQAHENTHAHAHAHEHTHAHAHTRTRRHKAACITQYAHSHVQMLHPSSPTAPNASATQHTAIRNVYAQYTHDNSIKQPVAVHQPTGPSN
jgi:hypothetical protein